MKLVAFETETWEAEACRVLRSEFDLTCTESALGEATVAAYRDAEIVTVFVRSRLTLPVLVQMPRLKLIVTRSTGYDHIDANFCAKAGIAVANVTGYGDVTAHDTEVTMRPLIDTTIETIRVFAAGRPANLVVPATVRAGAAGIGT